MGISVYSLAKDKQVRICSACGVRATVDDMGRCIGCGGPTVMLGPIFWTDEDEAHAMEDLAEGILEDPFVDESKLQDAIDKLWEQLDAASIKIRDLETENRALNEDVTVITSNYEILDAAIRSLKDYVGQYPLVGGPTAIEHLDKFLENK